MLGIRRSLGASLSVVLAVSAPLAMAPAASAAADTGWSGSIDYLLVSGASNNGQTFHITWNVTPPLLSPDTVHFPNPSFSQNGTWHLDYTNAGTDTCDADHDGVPESYPWSQTGSSAGTGTVSLNWSDASDSTHYQIGVLPTLGFYGVNAEPGNTTPCGSHPGGDVGTGAFALPFDGSWGTDATYSHASGNTAVGQERASWDLSRHPDFDGDGQPDSTDPCPEDAANSCPANDRDQDGVPNAQDNCPDASNPDQADLDGDHIGDVCDSDIDGDNLPNDTEPAYGTSPTNPDTDGDGHNDGEEVAAGTDPTDPNDYPGHPGGGGGGGDDLCRSVDASHREAFHPFYDGKIDLLGLPDIDLFHYQPSATYCWDGTKADWDTNASIYADTDGGLDEVLLNELGFDLAFDPTTQLADTTGNGPTAEFSVEFDVDFHPLKLVDKVGLKKKLEEQVTPIIARKLAKIIQRFGTNSSQFREVLRDEAIRLTEKLNDVAFDVTKRLRKVGVPQSLAAPLGNWVIDQVEKFNLQFVAIVSAFGSDAVFRSLTANEMADRIVARFFNVIDLTVAFPMWRPDYRFTVSPAGQVSFEYGPDHYINPVLLAEQKS